MRRLRSTFSSLAPFLLLVWGCEPPAEEAPEPQPPALPEVEHVPGETGVLIASPEGVHTENWDLLASTTGAMVLQAQSLGVARPVPAGVYVLRQYFTPTFTWADPLEVREGQTTRVNLGAIEIVTVPGAVTRSWDLWTADGDSMLSQANPTDEPVVSPSGTFTVKEYFTPAFVWSAAVMVLPGRVTRVELGGLEWRGGQGRYDLYDGSGGQRLIQAYEPDLVYPVPVGTYTLKRYFTDSILAQGVAVGAGQVTVVGR